MCIELVEIRPTWQSFFLLCLSGMAHTTHHSCPCETWTSVICKNNLINREFVTLLETVSVRQWDLIEESESLLIISLSNWKMIEEDLRKLCHNSLISASYSKCEYLFSPLWQKNSNVIEVRTKKRPLKTLYFIFALESFKRLIYCKCKSIIYLLKYLHFFP